MRTLMMTAALTVGALAGITLVGANSLLAETTGGATLAGGDNGAAAKADATAQAQSGGSSATDKGSPSAPVAPGQSTEHPDDKMRAQKNF